MASLAITLPAQTRVIERADRPDGASATSVDSWPQQVVTSIKLGRIPLPQGSAALQVPAPPPVNLSPGTPLHLSTPFSVGEISSVAWYKDDVRLSATAPALEIAAVVASDSGKYHAIVGRPGHEAWESDPVTLRVVTPARQSLLNLSTRATLSAANPTLIAGFVVASSPEKNSLSKLLLIRAVGPGLAQLGVAHPLAKPRIKFYGASGKELAWAWSGANPKSIAPIVGAFPLAADTADIEGVWAFPAGVYTIHVSGGDGSTGDVLLEMYEVPDAAVPSFYLIHFPTAVPSASSAAP